MAAMIVMISATAVTTIISPDRRFSPTRAVNQLANIAVLFISNNLRLGPLQRDDAREVILEVINVEEKGHEPAERPRVDSLG
jgi:hypothetical protein